jgi:hypothetical protein
MIWLTWRQLRVQITAAAAAVLGLAVYVVLLGLSVRHVYHAGLAGCLTTSACNTARIAFSARFDTQRTLLSCFVIALPGLLGAFWGAPIVTRELENGTHRLIWTQSVTRRSWLAPKIVGVTLSCVAVTIAAVVMLTWAMAPLDHIESRFAVISFDTRDVVPIGYAAFASALGITTGLAAKRTLVAMAVTLAVFTAVQIAVPLALRPHLEAPTQQTLAFNPRTIAGHPLTFAVKPGAGTSFVGYTIPGAWLLHRSPLLDSHGRPAILSGCINGSPSPHTLVTCITRHNTHWTLRYQPAHRYWSFQWIECAVFLIAAVALAGLALWRVPRLTV